jgi:hypothetical protein
MVKPVKLRTVASMLHHERSGRRRDLDRLQQAVEKAKA